MKLKTTLLSFIFSASLAFVGCDSDSSTTVQETVTYTFSASTTSSGLSNQKFSSMTTECSSLLESHTTNKPGTQSALEQLDKSNYDKYLQKVNELKAKYNGDEYQNDTNLVGKFSADFTLKRDATILLNDSIRILLPNILHSGWKNVANPNQILELKDNHTCTINLSGAPIQATYEQSASGIRVTLPDNTVYNFGIRTANEMHITIGETKHYFRRTQA